MGYHHRKKRTALSLALLFLTMVSLIGMVCMMNVLVLGSPLEKQEPRTRSSFMKSESCPPTQGGTTVVPHLPSSSSSSSSFAGLPVEMGMERGAQLRVKAQWFKPARDVHQLCRGQINLVMQFPVLAPFAPWELQQQQQQEEAEAGRPTEVLVREAWEQRQEQLRYAYSLHPIHRERRQAEYSEALRRNVGASETREDQGSRER